MAFDELKFIIKVSYLQTLLATFPAELEDASVRRALTIQINKLERMTDKFMKRYTTTAFALSKSDSESRRIRGPELHKLAQQAKVVDNVLKDFYTQWAVRKLQGPVSWATRKKTIPRLSDAVVNKVNAYIHAKTQAEILKRLPPPATKGLKGR